MTREHLTEAERAIEARLEVLPGTLHLFNASIARGPYTRVDWNNEGDGMFVADFNDRWADWSGLFLAAPADLAALLDEVSRLRAQGTALDDEMRSLNDDRDAIFAALLHYADFGEKQIDLTRPLAPVVADLVAYANANKKDRT